MLVSSHNEETVGTFLLPPDSFYEICTARRLGSIKRPTIAVKRLNDGPVTFTAFAFVESEIVENLDDISSVQAQKQRSLPDVS